MTHIQIEISKVLVPARMQLSSSSCQRPYSPTATKKHFRTE